MQTVYERFYYVTVYTLYKPLYTTLFTKYMCSPQPEPLKNVHLVLNMKYQN